MYFLNLDKIYVFNIINDILYYRYWYSASEGHFYTSIIEYSRHIRADMAIYIVLDNWIRVKLDWSHGDGKSPET